MTRHYIKCLFVRLFTNKCLEKNSQHSKREGAGCLQEERHRSSLAEECALVSPQLFSFPCSFQENLEKLHFLVVLYTWRLIPRLGNPGSATKYLSIFLFQIPIKTGQQTNHSLVSIVTI